MADVRLTGVTKAFGAVQVLKGVDLQIADGEFVVFVGPSGCGKSTLLRTIAGLEEATGGQVEIGGRVVLDFQQRNVLLWFAIAALVVAYGVVLMLAWYTPSRWGRNMKAASPSSVSGMDTVSAADWPGRPSKL